MSYALAFYTVSYKGLRDEILKPSKDFLEKLRETWKTVYEPETGESFESALDEAFAELKKSLAENKPELSTKGELAFVAAIESSGRKLGLLEQPTSGGDEFRDDFLNGVAAKIFNLPVFGDYLTKRPLFGFKTLEFPSWGGLVKDELTKLENVAAPPPTGNRDFDGWLAELARIIGAAKDAGRDMLTTYR